MKYKEELLKLQKQMQYFDNTEVLSELNGIADDAEMYKTESGHIGAVLVYHQLTEEIVKLLIKWCETIMRLKLYPYRYKMGAVKDEMFGEIMNIYNKSCIDHKNKSNIVREANMINKIRIEIAHNITKEYKEYDEIYKKMKTHFEKLWDYFIKSSKWFHSEVKKIELHN